MYVTTMFLRHLSRGVELVARHPLPANAVISFDYEAATADLVATGTDFDCACGAGVCRSRIVGYKVRQAQLPTGKVARAASAPTAGTAGTAATLPRVGSATWGVRSPFAAGGRGVVAVLAAAAVIAGVFMFRQAHSAGDGSTMAYA